MLQLKVAKTRLVKHRAGIARTIEREAATARQAAAAGDRLRARDALRKRRYWELALEKTSAMMEQLESVIAAIELAQLNKVVYDGLRSGTTALKQMQLELSASDAEKLMDEHADAVAVQDAVDAALGSAPDAEIEQELERLEADAFAAQLPSAPQSRAAASAASLPSPPRAAEAAAVRSRSESGGELATGTAVHDA